MSMAKAALSAQPQLPSYQKLMEGKQNKKCSRVKHQLTELSTALKTVRINAKRLGVINMDVLCISDGGRQISDYELNKTIQISKVLHNFQVCVTLKKLTAHLLTTPALK